MTLLTHFPTFLLLIGYFVFWIELSLVPLPGGHTSFLAPLLALLTAVAGAWCFVQQEGLNVFRTALRGFLNEHPRWFSWPALLGVSLILSVAVYAALLPSHLLQEYDALNYHITIPRQHLIRGDFSFIGWSPADLFLAPISHALAPYWLSTPLPNKIPQFFFLTGLLVVAARVSIRLPGVTSGMGVWTVVLLSATHAVGIQAGTAMLDLAGIYLFFAALDSYLSGKKMLAGVEFAFYLWSKPLMPIFILAVLAGAWGLFLFLRRRSFYPGRIFIGTLLVASILLAGPFLLKSWKISGTPLYPLTSSVVSGKGCKTLETLSSLDWAACSWAHVKDAYGHGRSWGNFIQHFWLIAVPEKGVNNSFDYPLGLMYLIVVGPFVFLLFDRGHRFPGWFWGLSFFILVYWTGWWFGSQQSRFLLLPLVGMIIIVAGSLKPTMVFRGIVLMALMLTCLSVVRAHAPDWGRLPESVLREDDKDVLRRTGVMSPGGLLTANRPDMAFCPVRVDVRGVRSIFAVEGEQ